MATKETKNAQPESTNQINWELRLKDWKFYVLIVISFVLCMCVQAGIDPSQLTTWKGVFDLFIDTIKNPFAICMVLYNVYLYIKDPTVKGIWGDSANALTYKK